MENDRSQQMILKNGILFVTTADFLDAFCFFFYFKEYIEHNLDKVKSVFVDARIASSINSRIINEFMKLYRAGKTAYLLLTPDGIVDNTLRNSGLSEYINILYDEKIFSGIYNTKVGI